MTSNSPTISCRVPLSPASTRTLPRYAGDDGFLGAQLLLLLGQISQQQPHHHQINREHEKTLGLEVRRLHSQRRQVKTSELPSTQ